MKRLLAYLPTHFTLSLVLGIVIQHFFKIWQVPFTTSFVVFSLLLCLLGIAIVLKKTILTTLLSWFFFFLLGAFLVYAHNSKHYTKSYLNFTQPEKIKIARIDEVLKPSTFYNKYTATIVRVGNQNTLGKILLNIQKNSAVAPLQVSDKIVFSSLFLTVQPPINPGQFNYKKYLETQGVYRQVFVNKLTFKKLANTTFSIDKLAAQLHDKVKKSLEKNHFKKEELSVIEALLLGQRNDLSKAVITNYKNAGAMHILAISGLHIGIILLILSFLLKPLERFKKGRIVKTILLVLLLWIFAFIAGLSASVVRAVTMFSFVAFGMSLRRETAIFQTIIASFFVLLICQPVLLFNVGFQLSYLAVSAIVWLQPILYKMYQSKWFILDKIWQYFTVSLAAQVGILPLSLYYFHQFPALFMLTNLVIIPALGLILLGGILVIVLAFFDVLPSFLATAYEFVIAQMNYFIAWVAQQESFLFDEISFSFLLVVFSYVFLFAGIRFLEKKSAKRLFVFLVSILFFQGAFFYEKIEQKSKDELLLFYQSRQTVLAIRKANQLHVYTSVDTVKLARQSLLRNYKITENCHRVFYEKSIPNFIRFHNKKILIVDSLGVYKLPDLKKAIVILRQSPKINLQRLIMIIHPQKIIVDGSNYKSYVKKWQAISKKNNVPFYNIQRQGAWIFKK